MALAASSLEMLYVHWRAADSMKQFAFALVEEHDTAPVETAPADQPTPSLLRLSVWYSLIHVVIEGYTQQGHKEPGVEKHLSDHHSLAMLETLRKGLFDCHRDPASAAMLAFLQDKKHVLWILGLNTAFRRFFERHLPSGTVPPESAAWRPPAHLALEEEIPDFAAGHKAAPPDLPMDMSLHADLPVPPPDVVRGDWRRQAARASYSAPDQFLAKCQAIGSRLSSNKQRATPYYRKIWNTAHFAHTFSNRIAPCMVALAEMDEQADFTLKVGGEFQRFEIIEVAEPVAEHFGEHTRLGVAAEDALTRTTRVGIKWIRDCIARRLQKDQAVTDVNLLLRIDYPAAYLDYERIHTHCGELLARFASVWLLKDNALCCLHADAVHLPTKGWIEIPPMEIGEM